jgi:hypothetical protein
MNKSALYALLATLAVVGCVVLAHRAHKDNLSMLPAAIDCANQEEARLRAGLFPIAILGTGSMQPLIPAAPKGADPMKTVVAYATLRTDVAFAGIRRGDLCLYAAEWAKGSLVMHQAARKDSDGWIMSGTANAHSESRHRVTEANFKGVVARVYRFPLPAP